MSQATARILDFPDDDVIPENELLETDGIPLDSSRQRKQINLAIDVIERAMSEQGADDVYVGGTQFVYTSPDHAREIRRAVEEQLPLPFPIPVVGSAAPRPAPSKKLNKGPDVFVVRGVEPREREVWASWLEGGRLPDFVFEIQSKSTAHIDAGEKRTFYAEVFRSREYFYYGPDDPELGKYRDVLVGLRLGPRGLYEPIRPDHRGWFWSEVLGLYVGRWDGVYDNRNDRWVRLYDAHGCLIPTGKEEERRLKKEERRLKEEERRLKEEERRLKEEERRLKEEERQRRKVAEEQAKEESRLRKAAEERAELEHLRAEKEHRQAEEERRLKEEERQRAELEHLRAEKEHRQAEEERRLKEEERQRAEQAQIRVEAAEAEITRLRKLME